MPHLGRHSQASCFLPPTPPPSHPSREQLLPFPSRSVFLGVSSTPGPRTLPGCHPASPSTCGVHGTKGSCPLRADTLLVDNVSDTCTPEFSAQMSPSSLPRSTQASSQVYPPTTSRATGLGVVTAEQQLWGVDRGQTWVGVSICIHTVWGGAGVGGGQEPAVLSVLLLQALQLRGVSLPRVRGCGQPPLCPPKLLSNSITPPPSYKIPHVSVAHFAHLYHRGQLHKVQCPVQNENAKPLVQKARKMHH